MFYGGIFDERSVGMTALALRAYAVGLIGFSFVKILAPAFFAREDTRTPVRIALIALATNLVLSVLLAWYLTRIGYSARHAGLALATSIAALLNAGLLYRGLIRDKVLVHGPGWLMLAGQALLANAGMWVLLLWLRRPMAWWLETGLTERILWLAVCVAGGAATYLILLLALGLRPSALKLKS